VANSHDVWARIKTNSIKEEFENTYVDFMEDVFENSANYNLVYKNFDYATTYKTLIMNYNSERDSVGVKKLVSYPYATVRFEIGDYIHWTYGGSQKTWLMTSLDKQFTYNVNGRMERCVNNLKWIDSYGKTVSYPCVMDDKLNETTFDFKAPMYYAPGTIFVIVQKNVDTNTLKVNDRFIFDGQAFKIQGVNNFIDGNTIKFSMFKDIIADDDDLVNGIANATTNTYTLSINQNNFQQIVGYTSTLTATLKLNGEVVTEGLTWSSSNVSKATINSGGVFALLATGSATFTCSMTGNASVVDTVTVTIAASPSTVKENRINPQVTSILQNNTQVYTVYQYVNNVKSSSAFTFAVSGANSSKYAFTTINGNGFSVKSLGYHATKLTVTCTNVSDSSTATIEIQLKGLF
jgi:hypothetical protein